MSGWLYILRSKNGRYYIGSTKNIGRRLRQHRLGHTRTTRVLKAYDLVYTEEFDTETETKLREKKLKSYKSRKYIEWLISKKPS